MKKIMLFAALTIAAYTTKATDLVVQENGPVGTYASISAAITAAVDGDRIIINNRPGGLYWAEDLTINKSLQFLSYADTIRFKYQGTVTITPAVGREITIIGMENNIGSIIASVNSPAGTRTKVNIFNCLLTAGSINFDYNYFDINLVSNILNGGNVTIRYGKLIGNMITTAGSTNGVIINTDAIASNDSIQIIGNKIYSTSYSISLNTSAQYFFVSNNLLKNTTSTVLIFVGAIKTASGLNSILNNSFYGFSDIYLSGISGYRLEILNNVAYTTNSGYYFLYFNGGTVGTINASYNYMHSNLSFSSSTGYTNNGTNVFSTNVTYSNSTTLINSGSSPAINGAHPGKFYYDLDLTRGDAGCYGSSWTLNNFFPISGSSRVYMITSPRAAISGSIINIKADGFDR
ncbi:MAG: hypothetical protein WC868_08485 [Bacteroidales bacterium]